MREMDLHKAGGDEVAHLDFQTNLSGYFQNQAGSRQGSPFIEQNKLQLDRFAKPFEAISIALQFIIATFLPPYLSGTAKLH